jgi:hypothetical protein
LPGTKFVPAHAQLGVNYATCCGPIMRADANYYWVVICKNHNFHNQQNRFFGHKIPLGETDSYSPMPTLDGNFTVRCDECGREYSYKPSEVLRLSLEYRDYLVPHPLFL